MRLKEQRGLKSENNRKMLGSKTPAMINKGGEYIWEVMFREQNRNN